MGSWTRRLINIKGIHYIAAVMALLAGLQGAPAAEAGGAKSLNDIDILKLSEWTVTSSHYGGKLLLADSPEIVPADGITYRDTIEGDARLFFHHVNGTTENKKIVVLLENTGSEPAHITVFRHGLSGPSLDYFTVGKAVQMEYMKDNNLYLLEVPSRGAAELAPGLSGLIVRPNELVNGMYDFRADRPVRVTVLMMPVKADVREFAARAEVLPADQYRLRGTFDGKDRILVPTQVYNPKENGLVAVTLADNVVDTYVTGIDATDGSKVLNYGNYGIVYKLFIPSAYTGKVSYYLNPRGGAYAGGLGVTYRHQEESVVATPADRLFFGGTVKDFAPVGSFDGGQSLWLTFSPPGVSNLPVKLLIAPGGAKADK